MALKLSTRKQLLSVIQGVHPPNDWKVLVGDKRAVHVLNSCLDMDQLGDVGVSLVEPLEKDREPLPALEAVYIISPQEKSIDKLIEDFKDEDDPTYAAAHIFFTMPAGDNLLQKLGQSAAFSFIKTLKEVNVEYTAYEKQVFHFRSNKSFRLLYSSNSDDRHVEHERRSLARKIASVCATLNDKPVVRFARHSSQGSSLAGHVQAALDDMCREYEDEEAGQLIIFDRVNDLISPLLHEFTYQALVNDVLDIDGDHDQYKYEFTTKGGTKGTRTILLNEDDPIWSEIRHMHIANAGPWLRDEFARFKASKIAKSVNESDRQNLGDMAKAVPEYTEKLRKFSQHIDIADRCFKKIKADSLHELAEIEQIMATGEDGSGSSAKPGSRFGKLMANDQISKANRLRLALLYQVTQGKVKESEMEGYIEKAQLGGLDRTALNNIRRLLSDYNTSDAIKTRRKKNKGNKIEHEFESSRYTPFLTDVLEEALKGSLSKDDFPFADKSDAGRLVKKTGARGGTRAHSLRGSSNVGNSKRKGKGSAAVKVKTNKSVDFVGPRNYVFVVGGMTFSEMRTVYELSVRTKREVIIGSTHLCGNATEFIASLAKVT